MSQTKKKDAPTAPTGVQLIAKERARQIADGRTVAHDVKNNDLNQLSRAAAELSRCDGARPEFMPAKWSNGYVQQFIKKSYRDRLIIAGALIAAEIDRIDAAG